MIKSTQVLSLGLLLISLIEIVQSVDPIISSYSRDGYGRQDPNKLLNGFFPVWGIILLCLAGIFLLISIISFILYNLGCRPPQTSPQTEFKKVPVS